VVIGNLEQAARLLVIWREPGKRAACLPVGSCVGVNTPDLCMFGPADFLLPLHLAPLISAPVAQIFSDFIRGIQVNQPGICMCLDLAPVHRSQALHHHSAFILRPARIEIQCVRHEDFEDD
jgi:hypothetical protein